MTTLYQLSPYTLSTLLGVDAGYPNPNGGPDPDGPLGPVIRQAMRWVRLIHDSGQPLSWPQVTGTISAQLIERVAELQELALIMPDDASAPLQDQIDRLTGDFEHWCAAGRMREYLLKWLKHRPGRSVPPVEWPPKPPFANFGDDLVLIGLTLQNASHIHPELGKVGESLSRKGIVLLEQQILAPAN